MERKRPTSRKSSKKRRSSESNAEETTVRKNRPSRVYKRINYCEDSSSDDLEEAVLPLEDNQVVSKNTISKGPFGEFTTADKVPDSSSDETDESLPSKFSSSPTVSDSRSSSPFPMWAANAIKQSEPLKDSIGEKHKNDEGASDENAKLASSWERYKAIAAKRKEIEELKKLKMAEREAEKAAKKDSDANLTDLKFPPMTDLKLGISRPFDHSKVQEKHTNPVKEQGEGRVLNKPIGINKVNAALIKQAGNTEIKSSKMDNALKASIIPDVTGSKENKPDMTFSPETAANKGIAKRRSDPNKALKENRPRPSI